MIRKGVPVLLISLTLNFSADAIEMADTVLINAHVYGHQTANSVAITRGRILEIGTSGELQRLIIPSTQIVDLEGGFVMPGFIDNHNHIFEAASQIGGQCELSMSATLEQQIPYLKACRESNDNNNWVIGYGYSIESLLVEGNKRTPLEVIDTVFPNQPAIIMEQTSHSMWVNTIALQKAGISTNTPDPQGGKYLKDRKTGSLNGILLDNAGDMVMELAWNSIEEQFEQNYEGLMAGLHQARIHGITTIGDGRLYWKRGWYQVWKEAERRGDITARVSLRPWIYPEQSMEYQLSFLEKILSPDHMQLLWVDQVKMYSDGILINATAKVLIPYLQTYIPTHPYGINYIGPLAMEKWLKALDKIGYGAHIHAIGDGAIRESLDAIAAVREKGGKKNYTLTHVELVNPKDIERFRKLGVTADFQVGSDYVAYHDHQWAEAFIGVKRARTMMNLRAFFDSGVNVSLSSDWNVHDINPLVGIANSMIMGKTGLPSIEDAIDSYTINAAQSLGIDDFTGSIEIGKAADFVVLSQDISHSSIQDITQTEVWMTLVNGRIVFDINQQY
ncbi:amidohydrolase [Vibrio pectenicida]|uniref:Amidohydrolase n=1 Tax=Vibrio pectenicida TaxID=62763 RepID=A0A7Y3ZYW8_9VIBR|nr:amidohydrolase [Vibrio pectenicida]NOH71672.1 amidohydrolase [Vibrio pectenicida]